VKSGSNSSSGIHLTIESQRIAAIDFTLKYMASMKELKEEEKLEIFDNVFEFFLGKIQGKEEEIKTVDGGN
jgi:hypothetical protein